MSKRVAIVMFGVLWLNAFAAHAIDNLHQDFNPRVELAKGEKWRAVRRLEKGNVSVEFRRGVGVRTYRPKMVTAMLMRAEKVAWNGREYLLTVWQEGVHASSLKVFDPLTNQDLMIFERASLGDIQFLVTANGLSVTSNQIAPDRIGTQEQTFTWEAPKP